tara:strand:+ start:2777 stop:3484 length:708 start_codon:yes stop_codon:yes gene_type:complete
MQFIKSLIFNFLFYLSIIIIFLSAIPALALPKKVTLIFGKICAYVVIFLLRFVLNTKVIFHGTDNLRKKERFFIASAHQSLVETFLLQAKINYPIFILKKELLKIPLFGWYLRKIGSIEITRDTTTKENLNFFEKIESVVKKDRRPLLIFPQGTRVKHGERVPFKKGVGRIYETLKIPCIPVALNSGKVWPKGSFLKYSGDIHISFMEPIEPGKDKKTFLNDIEEKIYNEIDRLN